MRRLLLHAFLFLTVACRKQPNIIFILADDLEGDWKQNRLDFMPNLHRIINKGVSFSEHISNDPLCGPSRASLLSGRYPHNHGYRSNLDAPSIAAWRNIQNNTIGTWLTRAGYHTAYFGKYVNGLENEVPSGWNHYLGFDGILGTYNYYNAQQFNVTFDGSGETPTSPIYSQSRSGIHQADFLGAQAVEEMSIAVSKGRPFFLHVAPVMIHYGTCEGPYLDVFKYNRADPFWENALQFFGCPNATTNDHCSMEISPCVSAKNAHFADNLTNPITPAWGAVGSGVIPPEREQLPPATAYEIERQNIGFRNRTGSSRDFDDMLGTILDGIDALGLTEETLVIVTSDNVSVCVCVCVYLCVRRAPLAPSYPNPLYVRHELL